MNVARMLFPALRTEPDGDFSGAREVVEDGLRRGVGGFILFGGAAGAVRELTAELRERSEGAVLIGADLERGAGQQFRGATPLPPAAALGALDDVDVTRRAAELTAREARALGVDWIYAPVADIDLEPRNPIVGTRAFGTDAETVARHAVAWIEGCRAGGGLSCAKHFPGHGRTVADSHVELPRVDAGDDALDVDLRPFRDVVRADVDSIMTAHVAYPTLDPSGAPATLSRPIVGGLLREELGFDGLVVTDALIMEGAHAGDGDEGDAALRAAAAGCDALLYPSDVERVAAAIETAVDDDTLPAGRVRGAIDRIAASAQGVPPSAGGGWGADEDRAWALDVAARTLRVARGHPRAAGSPVDVVVVDDDLGGPWAPPARDAFPEALRAAGIAAEVVERANGERPAVVALYADIRAWKGRPGISTAARSAVRAAVGARPDATVVLFGHPRLADEAPGENVLAAWGGEALMQEAAARRLAENGAGEG